LTCNDPIAAGYIDCLDSAARRRLDAGKVELFGSAATADGALTGTAIEADGNERPAANPAATAIATVAAPRSKRFTIGSLPGRRDRLSDSDQLIANT
jgi:hypothetical protein